MFDKGQLVICIDDSPSKYYPNLRPLTKGKIYTVSGSCPEGAIDGITLEETTNFCCCLAQRFRPISKNSADIFNCLLISPPIKELVSDV